MIACVQTLWTDWKLTHTKRYATVNNMKVDGIFCLLAILKIGYEGAHAGKTSNENQVWKRTDIKMKIKEH